MFHRILDAIVVAALLCTSASSQTLTFSANEDAPAKEYDKNSTHADTDLSVRWYPHPARRRASRSFLRFQVSGTSGVTVNSLHLRLDEGSEGSAGNVAVEVRDITGLGWTEDDLTWANMPTSLRKSVGFWDGSGLSEGGSIYIPLDLNTLNGGDGSYDLLFLGVGSDGYNENFFQSSEDSNGPQIIVNGVGLPTGAGFYTKVTDGPAPFSVPFSNYSTRAGSTYAWDFGDGTSSTAFAPTHTYTNPGRYDVTLTVSGSGGVATSIRNGYILAYPQDVSYGAGIVRQSVKLSGLTVGVGLNLADSDMFGRAVAAIGDLDGNGITELLVGAVGDDDSAQGGEDMPGACWILFLGVNGKVIGTQKISETSGGFGGSLDASDGFGRVVSAIGDLDGDGVPDVAVGANYDDDGGSNRGAVYVLFLLPNGTVKGHQKISSGNSWSNDPLNDNDQFGRGIANLGDLDGDGIQDLAVGATGDDDGGTDVGCVYVLFMNSDGSVKDWAQISRNSGGMTSYMETTSSLWFGMAVASLGDVDSDGVTDIAVGALLDDSVYHASGAAYVILLNADGTVKQDHFMGAYSGQFDGELEAADEFGGAVAGPGDMNNDGVPDLVVSSIRDDDNPTGDTDIAFDRGAFYVFFLNTDGSVQSYQKVSSTRGGFTRAIDDGDRFSESLGWLGDFDGDGRNDLLAGARFDDDGGLNRGAVHLLMMNNGVTPTPTADFGADQTGGASPLGVTFTDASSGSPAVAWDWDFGDGGSATQQSPSYIFQNDGTYDVSLTVTDALGQMATETKLAFVTVGDDAGVVLYGCGVNPDDSITVLSGGPVLGTTMVFGVDNPLGTQPPGSFGGIVVSLDPAAQYPCGTPFPGFGMNGGSGELLVSLTPPNPVRLLRGEAWVGPGNFAAVSLVLPQNPAYLGVQLFVQGYMVDTTASSSRVRLANAFALILR